MDTDRKILRMGAAVILCAALLRLAGGVLPDKVAQAVNGETFMSLLLFLETGRWVNPSEIQKEIPPPIPTLPQTQAVMAQQTADPLVLTGEDVQQVELSNNSGYEIDVQTLLRQPLSWKLREETPTVLILHTHGTESYTKTEDYEEDSDYRTLDERYNVISVGEHLAACLEAGGIRVIHDKTAYDYPSYSGSYNQARKAVEQHLQENPGVCLILDIHRDAMTDSEGRQLGYTQETEKGTAAKLMLVAGTDAGGLEFPSWQENLSLMLKLQAVLQTQCPGICRPLSLRTGRFNQDLFSNMVLVEVGAAGNTRQQALLAAEQLAQGILQMADGVIYE